MRRDSIGSMEIEKLGIEQRYVNALKRSGYFTTDDLAKTDKNFFIIMNKGIGSCCMKAIVSAMKSHNLKIKGWTD